MSNDIASEFYRDSSSLRRQQPGRRVADFQPDLWSTALGKATSSIGSKVTVRNYSRPAASRRYKLAVGGATSGATVTYFPIKTAPENGLNWKRVVGPVYTNDGFAASLGVNADVLNQLDKSNQVASFQSNSGRRYYPAFQFVDGRLLEGLPQLVLAAKHSSLSDLEFVSWMNRPRAIFDDRSAWDVSGEAGHIPESVLSVIRSFDSEDDSLRADETR